jgi:hypothetical protein
MDQTGVIAGPHTRIMLAAKAEETRNDSGLSGWSDEERALLMELQSWSHHSGELAGTSRQSRPLGAS